MESENISTQRHEKIIVEFYNRIAKTQVEEYHQIPADVQKFLSFLDYKDMAKPFVGEELESGTSRRHVAKLYGLTEGWCRDIGRKFGFLPKNKWLNHTH